MATRFTRDDKAADKTMIECFLCKRPFQFGEHIYDGRRVHAWDVMICNGCDKRNWDGVVPSARPHLVPFLQSKGIPVKLNAKGWIDIPA
jgi:hypothetical protein